MNDLQRQREDFAKEVASIAQASKRLVERAEELGLTVEIYAELDDDGKPVVSFRVDTKPHIETIAKG